jgi:2-polyprenyl-3-methyl-5-hydroxy-6-metoxy-1,4-benzoquinol methylase
MATIDENLRVWNNTYDWSSGGDEWSAGFGGTEALWFFILYPRIHRFVPSPAILEIAPGFGRWTQFLRAQCQSMIAVDISERCIEHCKMRFASESHIKFHVNDGTSLAAVPDDSIDFVFSFDSLVHVETDIIEAYLLQLARKLTPDGVGFIHHSNIGAYPRRLKLMDYYYTLPHAFRRKILTKENISTLLSINLQAGRAKSMTAALFREYCRKAGLKCICQELINWSRGKCLIDAISVFAKPNSRWDTRGTSMDNSEFVESAGITSRLSKLYCP